MNFEDMEGCIIRKIGELDNTVIIYYSKPEETNSKQWKIFYVVKQEEVKV